MKTLQIAFFLLVSMIFQTSCAQKPVNWTSDQLMDPAQLASVIQAKKNLPMLISVGPSAVIPNSTDIGMMTVEANVKKLKDLLATTPKNTKVVVYCGCCPYDRCPNVRPAIDALKELKFTNYFLLDLPHNIRKDWIDKGYPTQN